MSNKIIKNIIRLAQIAALTLTGATAAYAYPSLCPSGATGQATLCSSCHTSFLSPSKLDYNGGCLDLSGTTTTTTTGSTTPTTTSTTQTTTSTTTSTTTTSADTSTDTEVDSDSDSDSDSHRDHKEHKHRRSWLDAVGASHANYHSRFFRDPHDNRLHRHERD